MGVAALSESSLASLHSSRAASAFPAALGTASGNREQRGAWGHILGKYLGNKEITMLWQLQEELFELGSGSSVASQVRVMNQSSSQRERRGE